MSWSVLHLTIPSFEEDEASGWLWLLGTTAVAIEETPDPSKVFVVASFPNHEAAAAAAQSLAPRWKAEAIDVSDDSWLDAWRQHFEPVRVGRFVIAPSWKPWEQQASEQQVSEQQVIELDPGRAFGTGGHASTRLALELLQKLPMAGHRVLDVGCGSGVLSIAAAKLGAASVEAIDIEDEAVRVTRRNAEHNGVGAVVEASTRPVEAIGRSFDVIVANILFPVLVQLAGDLAACVAPGGCLVLSGIIDDQAVALQRVYAQSGLEPDGRVDAAPWVALLLRRPDR